MHVAIMMANIWSVIPKTRNRVCLNKMSINVRFIKKEMSIIMTQT